MDWFFKGLHYLLILAIVVIGGLLLISAVPVPGNIEVKIVQSGSMEPVIHTGSLVIIKPESEYKEGEIITFMFNRNDKVPTTHRIVSVRQEGDNTFFLTKGDANENADPREIRERDVIGKVLLSVPYLGYVLDFAKKPLGFAIIIGIPAALVVYEELGKIWKEIRRKKEPEQTENNVS